MSVDREQADSRGRRAGKPVWPKQERRKVTLVDDYAHNPTEVAAGLDCLREM